MNKILFISYNFPPQLSGVRRVIKFIKYLYPLGWQSLVLTVKNIRSEKFDSSPIEEIKSTNPRIFRTGSLDPYRLSYLWVCLKNALFRKTPNYTDQGSSILASSLQRKIMAFLRFWIFTIDDRILWLPFALPKSIALVLKLKPDWMLTTSLPNTNHLVGLVLKALFPSLKWVADFRDGWTQSRHYYAPPTPLHRWINQSLERAVARRCDLLITVSQPLTEHFLKILQNSRSSAKCHTITNGYDPSDYVSLGSTPGSALVPSLGAPTSPSATKALSPPSKFSLVYTGSFFGTRSPEFFLQGMAKFLSQVPAARNDFSVTFYSQWDKEFINYTESLNLTSFIQIKGFVPYLECLQAQVNATALLLLIPSIPYEPIMMTQKVFEYLASRRPILTIAPEGIACVELLKKLNCGVFAHPDNSDSICHALVTLYDAFKENSLDRFLPSETSVTAFSRPALAAQLNQLMSEFLPK